MDASMLPQSMAAAPYYFTANSKQQHQAMYRTVKGLPTTPIYSRPGSSSSCVQPPTLYSNGPAAMTPAGTPTNEKPSIVLDTNVDNIYLPSTPPLSTNGSTVGSPLSCDALQTPVNPMFSGLDGLEALKQGNEVLETSVLDLSACGSPPVTPVYLHSHQFGTQTSDLFSLESCPSLSPSSTPYARSVAGTEHDVDFCDPRQLTVASGSLVPDFELQLLCDDSTSAEVPKSQPAFDFTPSVPSNLPSFEDLSDFESEDDFVNSLVNLGDDTVDTGRPRACTGSSVVSLGHGSFIADDDFHFGESESFQFTPVPTPCAHTEDTHKAKRQKKDNKKDHSSSASPAMDNAANSSEEHEHQDMSVSNNDKHHSSDSDENASGSDAPAPAPANRRGRKQSLTEDPSKTFVCELCNRRFRRQEHLKRHYRSLHTQDKPFKCGECGKTFSRSDNLAQHARTHAGGAIVMNLIDGENGEAHGLEPGMMPPSAGNMDFSHYGKVLFQIASEVPGSSSDMSDEDENAKKRKRSD